MKWYTCCPVAFTGCESFFRRDSGAFCLAFQQLGIESKTILPLPVRDENGNPNLIRTEYKNLESVEWWKSLELDGLVLYAWGMGKYTPIVKAAREAGIYVITYMDTSGIYYPWKHWLPITSDMWYKECYQNGKLLGTIRTLLKIIKKHSIDLPDWGRKNHFKYASLIAFPLPEAINSIKNLHWLYGKEICNKLITITNPILGGDYTLSKKTNTILAVGRWNDILYKRPQFLMKALELAMPSIPNWTVEIYGNIPDSMKDWHKKLSPQLQSQILLQGYIPNAQLQEKFASSKISICSSRTEGTHVASAEAVCAGCSIVGPLKTPHLNCLQWYSSHNSGLLSPKDTPESLAQTLIEETQNWENGNRHPEEISSYWQEQLLAVNSCKKILTLYSNYKKFC